jgi:ketosteroid isomerase-like protein
MPSLEDTRVLAKHFFDSIERGDIDAVQDCYAPEARIWHNTDEVEQTREANIETLKAFVRLIPSRVYADRRVHVFPGGFSQQHELRGVRRDGANVRMQACIVCSVEGGLITRLDEYLDGSQVATFIGQASI